MKQLGYIIDGVYYSGKKDLSELREDANPTHKGWDHDRQRENHRRDIIQPFSGNKINQEFIEQYPNESKENGFI